MDGAVLSRASTNGAILGGQQTLPTTSWSNEQPAADALKTGAATDIVESRFIDLVPGVRVLQAVDFVSDDPAYAGTMTMTWEVTEVDGGTRVDIIADNVPDGNRREGSHSRAGLLAHEPRGIVEDLKSVRPSPCTASAMVTLPTAPRKGRGSSQ
jgi:Activator of Hsp90 ATPase homolog 1-like protein